MVALVGESFDQLIKLNPHLFLLVDQHIALFSQPLKLLKVVTNPILPLLDNLRVFVLIWYVTVTFEIFIHLILVEVLKRLIKNLRLFVWLRDLIQSGFNQIDHTCVAILNVLILLLVAFEIVLKLIDQQVDSPSNPKLIFLEKLPVGLVDLDVLLMAQVLLDFLTILLKVVLLRENFEKVPEF